MQLGHRGANHPVKDLTTSKVEITSQNHGFEVDPDSIPSSVTVTHKSLFDGCLLYTSPSPRDGLLSRMPSSA